MIEDKEDALTGRALLLDVALRLFMERGYDGVSMQDIATAANMTKGSPYYHFKGKEDLFLQAMRLSVVQMNERLLQRLEMGETLQQKLVSGLAEVLLHSDPGMIRLLEDLRLFCRDGEIELLPEEELPPTVMRTAYRRIFEDVREEIRIDPEMAAETLMALQLGMLNMRLLDPAGSPLPITSEEAWQSAEQTVSIFLHGVVKP